MRVSGEGDQNATVMLVGEGPGWQESLTGRPFVETAPAGAELTRYFNGIRLPHRSDCWVTNLVKEWPEGAKTKKQDVTPADVERDEWELHCELHTVRPKIVVCLGRHSARWFLGADVDMEAVHGLLFRVRYCPDHGVRESLLTTTPPGCALGCPSWFFYVMPIYHPAAGLHQPDLAARTAHGLDMLSSLLKSQPESWPHRCWAPSKPGVYLEHTPWSPYLAPSAEEQGIDTEGTPDNPWGISLSVEPGRAAVARLGDWQDDEDAHAQVLFNHNNLPATRVIFHNYPWDRKVLAAMGVAIDEDRFDDTELMAYLLGVEPQSLKALALRHLGRVRKDYEEVFGEYVTVLGKKGKPLKKKKLVLKSMDDVERQVATEYAGADADDTLSLKPILWQRVQDLGLDEIYEIDRRVLPLYSRMEEVGLPIDAAAYAQEQERVAHELAVMTENLQMAIQAAVPGAGFDFNPASPDQVAHVLFDRLKLPWHKKTPTGKRPSTNDKYLQALKHEHPIVQAIIDWRELNKHKNTFIDPLPTYCKSLVGGAGEPGSPLRLFFELSPYRVVSGRLAAKNPNVLALPKYSALGKRFRRLVRPLTGRRLGHWDLSQIELRVIALDSGSSTLKALFLQGADIHGRTGARIFGGSAEDYKDDSAQRVAAKATNFSIPMGTTCWGLAEQQRKNGYPFPELAGCHFASYKARIEAQAEVCQAWIDKVIDDWGIRAWVSEQHAMARRYGYVQDRWGRKRWLPSVLSPNKQVREEALRQAQAFPPQAGARGFMKQLEARVWREVIAPLRKEGVYIEPLLDIHDDLLMEYQADASDLAHTMVGAIFNNTFSTAIPIVAKGSLGDCWGDL